MVFCIDLQQFTEPSGAIPVQQRGQKWTAASSFSIASFSLDTRQERIANHGGYGGPVIGASAPSRAVTEAVFQCASNGFLRVFKIGVLETRVM